MDIAKNTHQSTTETPLAANDNNDASSPAPHHDHGDHSTDNSAAPNESTNHCSSDSAEQDHCGTTRKSHHSAETKNKLVTRLSRIEGQVRGIKRMIEEDYYCDNVLNQIAAIQAAMNGVSKLLLENHVRSCVVERLQAGENEVVDELLISINKLMR
jgi:DNA-binding FrmR family transcriptional regulator